MWLNKKKIRSGRLPHICRDVDHTTKVLSKIVPKQRNVVINVGWLGSSGSVRRLSARKTNGYSSPEVIIVRMFLSDLLPQVDFTIFSFCFVSQIVYYYWQRKKAAGNPTQSHRSLGQNGERNRIFSRLLLSSG